MIELDAVLAQAGEGMQPSAWAFMLAVWSVIIGFTVWCFYKLLTSERQLGEAEADEPPPTAPARPPDTSSPEAK